MNIKVVSRISLAVCCVLVAGASFAQRPPAAQGRPGGVQGRGPGGQRGQFMLDLLKDLNLTKAQQTKVEALMKTQRAKMEALRAKPGDRAAKRPEMEKLRAEQDKGLQKIFTAAQYKKYKAKMDEMRKKFQGGGMRGPGGRPGGPAGKGGGH